MANYSAKNQKTIATAFARFQRTEEEIVRNGMIRLAQAGLAFLVEAHEQFQPGLYHPEEDDTLAYAVAEDGVIVESGSYNGEGGDIPGDARNKAVKLLSGTRGWVAVILSEMEGWYRVDWEMDFLQLSADEVRANFHKFFKKV